MTPSHPYQAQIDFWCSMPQTERHLLRKSGGYYVDSLVQEAYERVVSAERQLASLRTEIEASRKDGMPEATISRLTNNEAKLVREIAEDQAIVRSAGPDLY